jgi:hypothetical protein
MPTSQIETKLDFDQRLELARRIVFGVNFDSREYEAIAAWISRESGLEITKDQLRGYADKLREGILKPDRCKIPGILLVLRRIGAMN